MRPWLSRKMRSQVFGGYGYTREYPVERYMRDAKVMQIVEGTNRSSAYQIARSIKHERRI